jgi:hypothetical protein
MSLRAQLRFLAVASLGLGAMACSSLTEPSTYEVDKDSVIAARAKPEPEAPAVAPAAARPGAAALPRGAPNLPPAGQVVKKKGG